MTAVGIPMIWVGEEFGMPSRQTPNRPNRLDWSLLESDRNQDLLSYYKRLITLHKAHPTVQSNNLEFFHENLAAKVLAYVRWNNAGDRVVVVANFSSQFLAIRLLIFPLRVSGTSGRKTTKLKLQIKV